MRSGETLVCTITGEEISADGNGVVDVINFVLDGIFPFEITSAMVDMDSEASHIVVQVAFRFFGEERDFAFDLPNPVALIDDFIGDVTSGRRNLNEESEGESEGDALRRQAVLQQHEEYYRRRRLSAAPNATESDLGPPPRKWMQYNTPDGEKAPLPEKNTRVTKEEVLLANHLAEKRRLAADTDEEYPTCCRKCNRLEADPITGLAVKNNGCQDDPTYKAYNGWSCSAWGMMENDQGERFDCCAFGGYELAHACPVACGCDTRYFAPPSPPSVPVEPNSTEVDRMKNVPPLDFLPECRQPPITGKDIADRIREYVRCAVAMRSSVGVATLSSSFSKVLQRPTRLFFAYSLHCCIDLLFALHLPTAPPHCTSPLQL